VVELVVGLFSMVGTAAAGAGTAAAVGLGVAETAAAVAAGGAAAGTWAAGTTVAAASAGSTALSVLSGVATAGSILSTLTAGVGSMAQANRQAEMSDMAGQQEALASEERANMIRREFLQKVGAARVAFAASGLEIGAGSAGSIEDSLVAEADYATGVEKRNRGLKLIQSRVRSQAYSSKGEAEFAGSTFKALAAGADFGVGLARRG